MHFHDEELMRDPLSHPTKDIFQLFEQADNLFNEWRLKRYHLVMELILKEDSISSRRSSRLLNELQAHELSKPKFHPVLTKMIGPMYDEPYCVLEKSILERVERDYNNCASEH